MGLAALGTKMYQGQPALRYSLVLRAGCPRYKNVPRAASPQSKEDFRIDDVWIMQPYGWGISNEVRITKESS